MRKLRPLFFLPRKTKISNWLGFQPHCHPVRYAILKYCEREPAIRQKVMGRAIVALPLITQEQWEEKGFDLLPGTPPLLFKDQVKPKKLLEKFKLKTRIEQIKPVVSRKTLDDKE